MLQNLHKPPSFSANSGYPLYKLSLPTHTNQQNTLQSITTRLPPISIRNTNLHVNNSISNKYVRLELELQDTDMNLSSYKKSKTQATTSSNNASIKTIQFSSGSLHLPVNNMKKEEKDVKEIKRNIGIENSQEVSSYHKIMKDLENIIDSTHFPNSLKNAKNNFFDSKNLAEKTKVFSPKKILSPKFSNKTNKILSPLKLKTPNINFDSNIATSLLFSPNSLLKPEFLPNLEPSKSSTKKNGIVKSYAANTHQGLVRNYNEDRVAIILNIMKPANKKEGNWPLCSYFAIYDGHGGTKCAEFLRDNLHHYVKKLF